TSSATIATPPAIRRNRTKNREASNESIVDNPSKEMNRNILISRLPASTIGPLKRPFRRGTTYRADRRRRLCRRHSIQETLRPPTTPTENLLSSATVLPLPSPSSELQR